MKKNEFLATSIPHNLIVMEDGTQYSYCGAYYDMDTSSRTMDNIKPVIRNINDIVSECVQRDYNDGKPFIPLVELAKIAEVQHFSGEYIQLGKNENEGFYSIVFKSKESEDFIFFGYMAQSKAFVLNKDKEGHLLKDSLILENQEELFQLLIKWHFWIDMPNNEDVIYVTFVYNPYK